MAERKNEYDDYNKLYTIWERGEWALFLSLAPVLTAEKAAEFLENILLFLWWKQKEVRTDPSYNCPLDVYEMLLELTLKKLRLEKDPRQLLIAYGRLYWVLDKVWIVKNHSWVRKIHKVVFDPKVYKKLRWLDSWEDEGKVSDKVVQVRKYTGFISLYCRAVTTLEYGGYRRASVRPHFSDFDIPLEAVVDSGKECRWVNFNSFDSDFERQVAYVQRLHLEVWCAKDILYHVKHEIMRDSLRKRLTEDELLKRVDAFVALNGHDVCRRYKAQLLRNTAKNLRLRKVQADFTPRIVATMEQLAEELEK